MKKALLALVVLGALGGGGYAYYNYRKGAAPPTITTAPVSRGDVADTVGATGTLQAVTTVQVGTQVSGVVKELLADFNQLVKKGQVIARLDPSTIQTQIEQAEANLIRSQADLSRLQVALEDSQNKLRRARELHAKSLVAAIDLEAAEVAVKSAEAQIRSSEASITQARASLNQNRVNLGYTVITAPIDGLVISRNVELGQTVASSMSAPTLYVLAADLTKMQVLANLDESDVGRIRPGQHVSFRVDAYPAEAFSGTVSQVRLQPIVQQGVVSYATVINVPNPELKLKPGMTANINVEIARKNDVLRVPNAALRFRPTNEIYAALGQTPLGQGQRPAAAEADGGRGGARAEDRSAESRVPTAARGEPSEGVGRGGLQAENGGREGGGEPRLGRMMERMQNLSPEERERRMREMRARGFDPTARGRGAAGGRDTDRRASNDRGAASGGRARQGQAEPTLIERNPRVTTFDALFPPLTPQESRGRVWLLVDKQLKPVNVRLGISDGQASELLEGDLEEGTELVTNVIMAAEAARPSVGFPPFMGPGGRGGFDGRGGGGGNRGGGRGGGGRGGGL